MDTKQFSIKNSHELMSFSDKFELHRIDCDIGDWDPNKSKPEVTTLNNPNILQKILCKLGICNYAGDALTNYALSDLSTYLSTKYIYCSVGTDGTNGTTYTYTNLIAPVMSRVATTNAVTTTYTTNDTVTYTAVFTSDGDYTLKEAGIHDALTSGNMGARQTYYDWTVSNGDNFGAIWKIINNRGV